MGIVNEGRCAIWLGTARLGSERTHIFFGFIPHRIGPHRHESPGHLARLRGQQDTCGGSHGCRGYQGGHESVAARHVSSSSSVLISWRMRLLIMLSIKPDAALPGNYRSRTHNHLDRPKRDPFTRVLVISRMSCTPIGRFYLSLAEDEKGKEPTSI